MAGTTWASATRRASANRPTPVPWALTILVVEDDPDVCELLTRRLCRSGYEVRTAATGWAALTAVADWRPDLVVLDLAIAGPSGVEVCRRLRRSGGTADVPVILLSGADDVRRHEGMAAGADRYLTKPFSPRTLVAAVATLLPGPDDAA